MEDNNIMKINLYDHWLFCKKDLPDGPKAGLCEDGFSPVTIPHDWVPASPSDAHMAYGGQQGYLNRWGIGWYRLHFTLPEKKAGCRYFLHFGGVYERCTVYLNETGIAEHRYGYSGFSVEISDTVREGENLLAVRVDNSLAETSEWLADRWYSGAGIYRPVELEEVPACFLSPRDVSVKADYADGTGSFSLVLTGSYPGVTASVDGLFSETVPDDGRLFLDGLSVSPWSAEHPSLYTLTLALPAEQGGHSIRLRIGFRRVEFVPEQGMFVNGEPVKMKGVCLHHDAGCVGSAVTRPLLRKRLVLLKSMGCNAIRTSHNIVSEDMLDLCDELGFYVLDEAFDKWVHGSYSRFFETDVQEDLTWMILRDRNRPSVVMWSMGNEINDQGSASMLAILQRLCDITRALDDRPVTVAMSPHFCSLQGDPVEEHVEDKVAAVRRIADIVDVLGCNYLEQWYEAIHEACPEKLLLGTEVYLFFRGSYNHYFNYSTENPWMDVERHDYVIGGCLWAGVDYLGESMGFPSKGWGGALIQTNLVRKPISYLWESYWSDKPVVHISILDYTKPQEIVREAWAEMPLSDCWNYPMFVKLPMPYMIFSNCEEVRLSLNGKYFDIAKPADCESRILHGFLPLEPGTVLAEGICGGKVVCTHRLVTGGPASRLLFTDTQESTGVLPEQLLFTVSAVDADGVRNPRESAEVRFSVEGPCVIEGVDSGYLCSQEPFTADHIHMHKGRASVILRAAGPGRVTLHAYAAGLPDASITFTIPQ